MSDGGPDRSGSHRHRTAVAARVATLVAVALTQGAAFLQAQWAPLLADSTRSLRAVELAKPVEDTRLLHDMETLAGWAVEGIARIERSGARAVSGRHALRMALPMRDEDLIRREPGGRMMGSGTAVLRFEEPQDWSAYNRISLWVYVEPSPAPVHSLYLRFDNEGFVRSITDPHYASVAQSLPEGRWYQVLWEMPHLKRDSVTSFSVTKLATGQGGVVEGEVGYLLDQLELQRVTPTSCEGWAIEPDRLVFSHVGYAPGASKEMLAAPLQEVHFDVIESSVDTVAFVGSVDRRSTPRGAFSLLDVSALSRPGTYRLRAGSVESRPFLVSDTVWLPPLRKALNFYRVQRCGDVVPGVHGVCHADLRAERGTLRKPINGGWHDAGDLSQGSFRTAMSVYAMLELHDRLAVGQAAPELRRVVLDEAIWGLQWLLKTRFGDGYRVTWAGVGIYTDGEIGTADDIVKSVQNNPWENFIASATEARAAAAFRYRDPELAERLRLAAVEDWRAAVGRESGWLDSATVVLTGDGTIDNTVPFHHRWFSGGMYLTLSWGVLSSLHLFDLTGDSTFVDRAVRYGNLLTQCQEFHFIEGIPFTGYFYTSPEHLAVVNHRHAAFEESPLLALSALAERLPGHTDWMRWYGAVVLHSEYWASRGAATNAPYEMLPAAVYRRQDIDAVRDTTLRRFMRRQFDEGTRLSDSVVLRSFPIWTTPTHHGQTAVQLSQTVALLAAAETRTNRRLMDLAVRQLEWVFGRNPFGQTLMYGEGYDYPDLYAYNQGHVVGSLPVGMDALRSDLPFWPLSNHSTFKEVWIVPVSRFVWSAAYLAAPGVVEGRLGGASREIVFVERRTGRTWSAVSDAHGRFQIMLPPGDFRLEHAHLQRELTVLSGKRHLVDVDPLDYVWIVDQSRPQENADGSRRLSVAARGEGDHSFHLHLMNARTETASRSVALHPEDALTLEWTIDVIDASRPWIAVLRSDSDPSLRIEWTGVVPHSE